MSSDKPGLKGIENAIKARIAELDKKMGAIQTEKSQLQAMLEAANLSRGVESEVLAWGIANAKRFKREVKGPSVRRPRRRRNRMKQDMRMSRRRR